MFKLRFHKIYFLIAMLLLVTEVLIAAYLNDAYIRPYGGDFLVVILIYCTLQSFIRLPVKGACIGVLLFAYLIEVSQYYHLVNVLGWQHIRWVAIMLGTGFSWIDMLCYTAGAGFIYAVEQVIGAKRDISLHHLSV